MFRTLRFARYFFAFILCIPYLHAADVWDSPALTGDPAAIRQAAAAIKAEPDTDATLFLMEMRYVIDQSGKMVRTRHMIYRIESQDGVEGWAETRGIWEPWYQAKPEIRARVITPDGAVHLLDPKTLNDVPLHDNTPNVYSDERAYGGPLPAVSVGSIIEEETITRDTGIYFAGGTVERFVPAGGAPVNKFRMVLVHPESLPLRYIVHLMPDAVVNKSTADGIETIVIEKNALEPYREPVKFAPYDMVVQPQVEFTTARSWQQVASEYAHQVEEKLRTSDVQPLLDKLNFKNSSTQDAIRKIVAVLHKNVRYTGVEFDESSLIPQFPSEVLKRKYGDCKDKATLLVAMLRAAGIPANVALLDAGPGLDVNPDLPGMGGFDHAIVYVPATGSSPELWIDATSQYSQVGSLPQMDYGRWALIADEKTTGLKKIPEFTSAQNVRTETREFTLAEYGPAKIVEKDEGTGPADSQYRDYFTGDSKALKEQAEKYVKEAYVADSLLSFEKTDSEDLEKPFSVTYTSKGRRGFTELNNASMYIRQEALFSGLPDYFYEKEEPEKEGHVPRAKPRTLDWVFYPFVEEWRYKITAPAGFKVRAVPADKEEQLGTAHYSQKFKANQDGTVVEAVLRFDSGKSRLTVEEGKILRDSIIKAQAADPIGIHFDQVGYALLSQGKVKEALAADQQLAGAHPKEALHKMRLAEALLSAGLGEKARAVAREATVLDPKMAQAFNTLGWVLQHDLIGRLRHKGMDYEGALAAYRKGRQLDPKDKPIIADYAILLEHDAEGTRYTNKANLAESVAQFKELKKIDEDYERTFEDNVVDDLWYSEKFQDVKDYVATLPASDFRKGADLAATAALHDAVEAEKRSLELTSNESDRSKALTTAAYLLLTIRKYPESAKLYSAAAQGQNSGQLQAFAEVVRKTQPHKDLKISDSDPRVAISRILMTQMRNTVDMEDFLKVSSKSLLQLYDRKEAMNQAGQQHFLAAQKIKATSVPMEPALDIALSNAKYNVEGDDNLGYRISMQTPGAPTQQFFVVKEDGEYKIVNVLGVLPELAFEALVKVNKNDLAGARKWLDWARETVHLGGGDDPLAGPLFPRFWTKGQEADAATIRTAAFSALVLTRYMGEHLPELAALRDAAKTPAERNNLNLALAYAYSSQQHWIDVLPVAEELVKAYPESLVAYDFQTSAYAQLNRLDDWEKSLQARLQKHPDDPDYLRNEARLLVYRRDPMKLRANIKSIIDNGKANNGDLNEFAWYALQPPAHVDQDAVEAAERADTLTNHSSFGIMHTLVCLYAVQGKTRDARDLLLKAMDVAGLDEPNDAVWLALGMIAEQYGDTESARSIYAKVEKSKVEQPGSNYDFAQQRLTALHAPAGGGVKTAAKASAK